MAKIWGANKSFREKWENGEELSTAQYGNKQKLGAPNEDIVQNHLT